MVGFAFSMRFTYLEEKDPEVKEVLGRVGYDRLDQSLHSRISQNLWNANIGHSKAGNVVMQCFLNSFNHKSSSTPSPHFIKIFHSASQGSSTWWNTP